MYRNATDQERGRIAYPTIESHSDLSLSMVTSFFVYGTLKTGQRNVGVWPTKPRSITPGWVYGQLYAGDDYPAMIAGTDQVQGELWTFAPEQLKPVIQALDRLEGTNQPGQSDLYQRVIDPVYGMNHQQLGKAYVYLYKIDPLLEGFSRITDPPISWP